MQPFICSFHKIVLICLQLLSGIIQVRSGLVSEQLNKRYISDTYQSIADHMQPFICSFHKIVLICLQPKPTGMRKFKNSESMKFKIQ